ncbi:MAG: sulfur oxidation c-type cytochrome SoxA [Casimicrobiaceae bacterium]
MKKTIAASLAVVAAIAVGAVEAEPRSGIDYAGAAVRAMQADDAQNPGRLWIARGAALWRDGANACASCHGDAAASMKGVAARLPAWSAREARVVNLEDRINGCRVERQGRPALARESEDMNALTAYVATQSRGMPVDVKVDGAAHAAFERARDFYHMRRGQMNLACANCHEQNAGKRLLVETISEGHGNAFPAYRLEWQTVGSLQRRLRACLFGIRATLPPDGAQVLTELELYLGWRANGLPIEAPGVRR